MLKREPNIPFMGDSGKGELLEPVSMRKLVTDDS